MRVRQVVLDAIIADAERCGLWRTSVSIVFLRTNREVGYRIRTWALSCFCVYGNGRPWLWPACELLRWGVVTVGTEQSAVSDRVPGRWGELLVGLMCVTQQVRGPGA